MHIQGKPVYVSKPFKIAKFRISDNVILSTKFRQEINKWCDDFFGYDNGPSTLGDGQVIVTEHAIFVNEQTFEKLKTLD